MIDFPRTLPVAALDAQHPVYAANVQAWNDIDTLYCGGAAIKAEASRFLLKRPKEPGDIYTERVSRFTYQNILGTAFGWYQSALFAEDPSVAVLEGSSDASDARKAPYLAFQQDCNRGGKTYVDFWRQAALNLLLFRSAYVLIDLPRTDGAPQSLAEQRATGALDPFLVLYDPRQAVRWSCDDRGNLNWIVFASSAQEDRFGTASADVIDRWYVFDRSRYAVYQATRRERRQKAETAYLIANGPHALADQNRVPVRWVEVPEALWLANRVYLPSLSHLNMLNAYHWGLFMSCMPLPWVKGGLAQPGPVSEVAWLELAEGGEAGYLEPSGVAYQTAAQELTALREEIYRQMYLQAQARDAGATAQSQSGVSKEQDMAPSRDVLAGLGDVLRAAMQGVLSDVALVRGDSGIRFDVRGFDFDNDDSAAETGADQAVLDMNIPSATLRRELHKRVARRVLKDARAEVLASVESEIDSAPDQQQQRRDMFATGFGPGQ